MTVVCSCGKKLQIPDALAGQEVVCPFCRAAVIATLPAPAPDDPAASLIQALKSRPTAAPPRNQPPSVARAVPATAQPAPPAPIRSFPVHYYIIGGALIVLLVAAIVVIARSGEKEKPVAVNVADDPLPVTHKAPKSAAQPEAPSSDKAPDFFGDVPAGDSKDYLKRTGKKPDSLK